MTGGTEDHPKGLRLTRVLPRTPYRDWLRQRVLQAQGAQRLAEKAAVAPGTGVGGGVIELGGGASPEGPVDEGTPPLELLLGRL